MVFHHPADAVGWAVATQQVTCCSCHVVSANFSSTIPDKNQAHQTCRHPAAVAWPIQSPAAVLQTRSALSLCKPEIILAAGFHPSFGQALTQHVPASPCIQIERDGTALYRLW